MLIPKIIEEIKGLLVERRILQAKRDEYTMRVRKADDFFKQVLAGKPVDYNQFSDGVSLLQQIMTDLMELDKKMWEVDSAIVSFLEIGSIESIFRITTPDKVNDAGDMISNQNFYVTPIHSATDFVEITPDDLFVLRSIKATFGANNVEVIDKKDYYSGRGFKTFTMEF